MICCKLHALYPPGKASVTLQGLWNSVIPDVVKNRQSSFRSSSTRPVIILIWPSLLKNLEGVITSAEICLTFVCSLRTLRCIFTAPKNSLGSTLHSNGFWKLSDRNLTWVTRCSCSSVREEHFIRNKENTRVLFWNTLFRNNNLETH
jgi:hypothetical protein